jgi:formylmethanofuran dehydrogenase subunit A
LKFAQYMNKNKHFTADMGQITFGPATTMTGDGPFEFYLWQLTGGKWTNIAVDVELPGGAGIVPYTYSPKAAGNSVQWAIPLEFALNVDDVWRCIISTDHPNAGPFTKYPLVYSWLMSKKQRDIWMEGMHKFAHERTILPSIEREWSLYDVVISTRASPAKILGIEKEKGHIGVGADADVAVYDVDTTKVDFAKNPEKIIKTFSESFLTFLGGKQVSKKGKVKGVPNEGVYSIHPELNESLWARINKELEQKMNDWYSHSFHNYPVPERYRQHLEKKTKIDATSITA